MRTMQDMHQKMQAARTPQERAAVMSEHMKAMQGGMAMMCEMGAGMGLPGGPGPQASPGAPDMMKRCMEMRDMTMRMMMEREPTPPAPGK